jgi:hypothetical protein
MIVVFWLREDGPQAASFKANELTIALKFAESLRALRREGQAISHVCIQSEMPESVGQAGVSDPSKDYSWSKRRVDPSIPLGRPRPGTDEQAVDFSKE